MSKWYLAPLLWIGVFLTMIVVKLVAGGELAKNQTIKTVWNLAVIAVMLLIGVTITIKYVLKK